MGSSNTPTAVHVVASYYHNWVNLRLCGPPIARMCCSSIWFLVQFLFSIVLFYASI